MTLAASPIGVFDSGIGGLSVLQALRHELPHEHFVYLADSGNAPYGERGDDFVQERTHAIAQHLRSKHGIKALVIACNTATAAAVESLRSFMPDLPLIGVEPAIKPASTSSQTQHVGVIATRGTVESRRFKKLLAEYGQHVHFHVQACDGLARAIEWSTLQQPKAEGEVTEIEALSARYISDLGQFGLKTGEMDALVLGCTHYIFIKDELRALLGPEVLLIDTGAAVARQTRRLLDTTMALRAEPAQLPLQLQSQLPLQPIASAEQIQLMTTGQVASLQAAAQRWLDLPASCCTTVDV
ncbi:glutamate racemase [Comamonas sp.]|uniref:glutamate racemase n=1 Tax=Comamonas sp. TaxID=34028 RepID=UPI00258E11E0|nr:glutamate racemase [Comamonas sp.]